MTIDRLDRLMMRDGAKAILVLYNFDSAGLTMAASSLALRRGRITFI